MFNRCLLTRKDTEARDYVNYYSLKNISHFRYERISIISHYVSAGIYRVKWPVKEGVPLRSMTFLGLDIFTFS